MSQSERCPDCWEVLDLGLGAFAEADYLQKQLIEKKKNKEYNKDCLILAEFKPVITKGRRFQSASLLCNKSFLKDHEVELIDVDRGGDVTYHGPGQLMVYPVADLSYYGKDLRLWVTGLEEAVIRVFHRYGLEGRRKSGVPGVWVESRKIASVGVGCTQWMTYHGVGLNVTTDLEPFSWMVPCGLEGVQMTNMALELNRPIGMAEVKAVWKEEFFDVVRSIGK